MTTEAQGIDAPNNLASGFLARPADLTSNRHFTGLVASVYGDGRLLIAMYGRFATPSKTFQLAGGYSPIGFGRAEAASNIRDAAHAGKMISVNNALACHEDLASTCRPHCHGRRARVYLVVPALPCRFYTTDYFNVIKRLCQHVPSP